MPSNQSELFKYMEAMAKATGNTRGGDGEGNALARLLQSNRTPARSNAEALGRGVREFVLPHVISEIMGQIKTRNDRNTAQKTKEQMTPILDRWAALNPDEANMPLRLQRGGNAPQAPNQTEMPAAPPQQTNGLNAGIDQALANAGSNLSPQNIGHLFGEVQGAAPAAENLGADALEALKSLGENEELRKIIGNGLFGGIGGGGF